MADTPELVTDGEPISIGGVPDHFDCYDCGEYGKVIYDPVRKRHVSLGQTWTSDNLGAALGNLGYWDYSLFEKTPAIRPPNQEVQLAEGRLRKALRQIANARCVKGSEPQMLAMLQDMAAEALR